MLEDSELCTPLCERVDLEGYRYGEHWLLYTMMVCKGWSPPSARKPQDSGLLRALLAEVG